MKKGLSIRTKLTLQSVSLMIVVFITFSAVTLFSFYSWMRRDFDNMVSLSWGKKIAYFQHDENGKLQFFHPTPHHADAGRDSSFRAIFYEMWSEDGRRIYKSKSMTGLDKKNPFGPPKTDVLRSKKAIYESIKVSGAVFRLKSAPHRIGNTNYIFRAALEESGVLNQMLGLIKTFGAGLIGLIIIGGLGCYLLVRKALNPIVEMSNKVDQINIEDLDQRLPIINPDDEIGNLAGHCNNLLERLEVSFDEMKRFTSDASHELRTPLTAIRILGEAALSKDSSKDQLREALGQTLEETNRLSNLTESLLTMARLDRRGCQKTETFDFSAQTKIALDSLGILASEKKQTIHVDLPEKLMVKGHQDLVRQALMNIVDNAIKYGHENGNLFVHGQINQDQVQVLVKDDGPGVSEEHVDHLFKRFYRADNSRNRKEGGYGIGLSIAKRSIELSGGDIYLQSRLGEGSTFTIELPRA